MWETARDIYTVLPKAHRPVLREFDLKASFPTGANLKFSHMEHEKDRLQHQGLQYTFVGFDEGTHFTWTQVEYLMSRLRSKSKYSSRMVISCNPDPDSWLLPLIDWYLDKDGYPDQSKQGVIRYFLRRGGKFIWADTKKELVDKYSSVKPDGTKKKANPISFTFIASTIYDNPPCMEANPEYVDFLEGLNDIDKARLLHGNWYARPEGANYFKREWLKDAPSVPTRSVSCRPWDKASTKPHDSNPFPDFTACVKVSKSFEGDYYISMNAHPECYDKETDTFGRFKEQPGTRDTIIRKQAELDGTNCPIIFPVDPGAAGASEFASASKSLIEDGYVVYKDPLPINSPKLTKFTPFSSAAQNGLVYIVKSSFSPVTLEAFLSELEQFDGLKSSTSSNSKKDDWADCIGTGFNFVSRQRLITGISLPRAGINKQLAGMRAITRH